MSDPRFPIGQFVRRPALTSHERHEAIQAIEELPSELREATRRLTSEQLQTPYREGGWTLAQVIHHLPDSHMQAYTRTRLALTEHEPIIKPYREERWAELHDASSSHVEPSLLLLTGLHQRWVDLLRRLTHDQWSSVYVHPELGRQTLDDMLALYSWHGRHHVAHITALCHQMGW
jgi:hypothetical protein